jgi:hypothetical protein
MKILITLVLLVIIYYLATHKDDIKVTQQDNIKVIKVTQQDNIKVINIPQQPIKTIYTQQIRHRLPPRQPTTFPVTRDIIRDYDYNKLTDPLEQPTKRIDRYQIPPAFLRRQLDLASNGAYPDSFSPFGTLRLLGCPKKNPDNKLLMLFGRQEFPGSNRYEYYTSISSGNNVIKVNLNNKNGRELYCGDKIFIKELDDEYEIKLNKNDMFKYYPDIL